MGYRSDVTIIIYGETADVTAFVAGEKLAGKPKNCEFPPLEEPESDYHDRHVYAYGKDDAYTMMEFNWYDTKWYDNFPEVAWWDDLANMFEEAFPKLSMEVARVGESVDDNTTEYYGDNVEYYLDISREITKSLP